MSLLMPDKKYVEPTKEPLLKYWQIWLLLLFSPQLLTGQDLETFQLGEPTTAIQPIKWTGVIYSAEDKAPIINAVLQSDEGINGITNLDGKFDIILTKKTHTFTISALGFEDKRIRIVANTSAELSIPLAVEAVLIDEVIVSNANEKSALKEVTPGLKRLDTEQLEMQSKFFGEIDILRSLQSISGVSNTGEGASGFNVRGGNTDQNLILQDGHLIFNPSHALGFFSLFHPDLVQYVDLYKGGIPAKYGGRLSSVLAVETREGNKERFQARGGVGMVSSRLSFEGPIIKDKVSFIVGTRYSYADWIFGLVDNPEVNESRAFFNDVTAKVNARITPTTNIGGSFLRSRDDFQLGDEARFDYSTVSAEAYLKQLLGDKANFTLNVNRGRYESSLFDLKGNDQSKFTNAIDYTRGKADLLFIVSENYKFNIGVDLNLYDVSPGKIAPVDESIVIPDELEIERGQELAGYLENQFLLGNNWEISAGVRYTAFKNVGAKTVNIYPENVLRTERNIIDRQTFGEGETIATYDGWEPRVSVKYDFNEKTSVKAGYARTYQYLAQISNTASATPIDIWQLANQHVEPQYSDNFSIGLFKNFGIKNYESSVEAFYRQSIGILDYKDFAELLLNPHIETELVTGDGLAYGFELNLKKQTGSFRWDMNYTFSSSERQILQTATQPSVNRGEWFSSNYDIPHVFNLNMVKQFDNNTNLAINFTYRTGRPTTAPVSSYTNDNVVNIPIYSDRNKFRVPDFHRLDIAYTIGPFGKPDKRFDSSITLSVYNLYFRKNAYSVYFRQNPFESVQAIRVATLGTIFPSITYNFNIK
ncbi:MAG: TonB-dependent receptor, partial [Bacteroidota bacterium]